MTVAQYECFVKAGGYGEGTGWQAGGFGEFDGPEEYSLVYQTPNHPRVGVSWYEAMAFCQWLSSRLFPDGTERITMPNERAAVERAAVTSMGRIYPWGKEEEAMAVPGAISMQRIERHLACRHVSTRRIRVWCLGNAGMSWSGVTVSGRRPIQIEVLRGGAFWNLSDLVRCALAAQASSRLPDDFIGFRVSSSQS